MYIYMWIYSYTNVYIYICLGIWDMEIMSLSNSQLKKLKKHLYISFSSVFFCIIRLILYLIFLRFVVVVSFSYLLTI